MRFELINPSDYIEFEAESMFIAGLICALQGGQVSSKNMETGETTPFFIFGGMDEWLKQNNEAAETVIDNNKNKIIEALKSFRYPKGERTSMNNIVGWAHKLADKLGASNV